MQRPDYKKLRRKAKELRKTILKMLTEAGSGHPGGSLSCVEIIMCLYEHKLRHDPKNPGWEDRDRFIISKGHACPTLYAMLADQGYFPESELMRLRRLGSPLQGHPQLGLPGIEASTGSLGQGLSIAVGMALAARMDKRKDVRVYCMMGDGELNEGQIWEAAMSAAHYRLDNICGIVDENKLQIDGLCCEVMDPGSISDKWKAFGWHVIEADGHDCRALIDAYDKAAVKGKPGVIIADTVKGKGVSFMENKIEWHGVVPKKDQLEKALRELDSA